jgi:hypothetical protein
MSQNSNDGGKNDQNSRSPMTPIKTPSSPEIVSWEEPNMLKVFPLGDEHPDIEPESEFHKGEQARESAQIVANENVARQLALDAKTLTDKKSCTNKS